MDGLSLFADTAFSEKGASKKVGDSFDCFVKGFVGNLKIVICLNIRRVRVVHAWILVDKGRVLVVDGVLFRAHEEHMLKEVSETERAIGVLKTADTDRDRTGAFLKSGILNEKDLDAVIECEGFICSGVVGRFGRYGRYVSRILDLHGLKIKYVWVGSTL